MQIVCKELDFAVRLCQSHMDHNLLLFFCKMQERCQACCSKFCPATVRKKKRVINFPKYINPLKPNDPYRGRTAPLTSKHYILYIYSTNIGTEYFKHGIYSQFFPLQNALFHNSNIFCSSIIHILYTGCAKI